MKSFPCASVTRTLVAICLLALQALPLIAQTNSPRKRVRATSTQGLPRDPAVASGSSSVAQSLPLRRVILYSNGVAYFERRGRVRSHTEVELAFKQSQIDDVLKSMVVLDLGRGRIGAVTYNSSAPPQARLADIPFSIEAGTQNAANGGLAGVLRQLQGALVTVATANRIVVGNVLTIEERTAQAEAGKPAVTIHKLVVSTAGGEIVGFDLSDVRSVKLMDDDAQRDLREFASATASARRRDAKTIIVTSDGDEGREMLVSYTIAAPIWKTTYRVVMDAAGQPFFQGWAIVDNVSEEDWTNINLSLVSGTPVSFIQPIQQPFYRYRPVVPMPGDLNLEPQVYQPETGEEGSGSISGIVEDASGAVVPNAQVTATNQSTGASETETTDDSGSFSFSDLPAGNYSLTFESAGFNRLVRTGNVLRSGGRLNIGRMTLPVGGVSETVEVTASQVDELPINGRRSNSLNMLVDGASSRASLSDSIMGNNSGVQTAASGAEVGDLFEYRVDQPVTVQRDRSALIPILQTRMTGERVSIYNEAVRADRPLSGMLLKNTSSLTLEGGSLTVIDADAYAGEALMERLKPGEDRLISFALDLGTLVTTRTEQEREPVFLVKALNGVLQAHFYRTEKKTYTLTNQTERARTVYIERPIRQGWELKDTGTAQSTRTPQTYRVRVELPAGKTVMQPVIERQALMETFALSNFTSRDLELLVARRYVDEATRARLSQIVELKSRIAALDANGNNIAVEANEISADQARLRENIKALGETAEARSLIMRYVEKANTQETRLEALTVERRRLVLERTRLQAELDALIRNFVVESKV